MIRVNAEAEQIEFIHELNRIKWCGRIEGRVSNAEFFISSKRENFGAFFIKLEGQNISRISLKAAPELDRGGFDLIKTDFIGRTASKLRWI